MTSKVTYNGGLRTECVHLKSNDSFVTDAPVDNNGLGQAFSPTDTVATGLASCMLTMMGIKANGLEVDLIGTTASVSKHMAASPRRISKIEVEVHLPKKISDKNRKSTRQILALCSIVCIQILRK